MATNQQGTGFTNLQSIMQANQGNRLGQAVGSGIKQTGEKVKQGLQTGQQEFQTKAQANQLGTQAQRENVENVLKDPTQANEGDVSNFAKYRSGQYTGPQNIGNIDTLKQQAGQAEQQGQAIGSEGGRQSLLQRYAAGPGQYNAGAQRLDNLLLGTTGTKDLQAARRSVSGLNTQITGAEQAAQQTAQQLGQQAKGFGEQVTGKLKSGISNIYDPAAQEAQQANTTEKMNAERFQNEQQAAQGSNKLSKDALTALGYNAGDRSYGVNLGQYMGYNPANEQATALNVMQQPQFQKYTGLQKLMGQTPSAAPQTQYQAGKTTYDAQAAQDAISQAKAAYDKDYNPASQSLGQYKAALAQAQQAAKSSNPWISGLAQETIRSQYQPNVNKYQAIVNDLNQRYGGTITGPDEQ